MTTNSLREAVMNITPAEVEALQHQLSSYKYKARLNTAESLFFLKLTNVLEGLLDMARDNVFKKRPMVTNAPIQGAVADHLAGNLDYILCGKITDCERVGDSVIITGFKPESVSIKGFKAGSAQEKEALDAMEHKDTTATKEETYNRLANSTDIVMKALDKPDSTVTRFNDEGINAHLNCSKRDY